MELLVLYAATHRYNPAARSPNASFAYRVLYFNIYRLISLT